MTNFWLPLSLHEAISSKGKSSNSSNSFAPIVIADETVANSYVTSLSLSSQTKLAEVNTNLLTFICLLRSSDTVDAFVTVTTNQ